MSVKGPEREPVDAHRGVRRRHTSEIVSILSSRYELVRHREVAEAVHAIGTRAERDVPHNALLARWASYQGATDILTHDVGSRVSPERPRGFERIAAGALLLPRGGGPPDRPYARKRFGAPRLRPGMVGSGPLPSEHAGLPPNCPLCGQPMDPGVVVPGMSGLASSIYWVSESDKVPSGSLPHVFAEENILAFRRLHYAQIPGLRCTICKVVIGRYPGWPPPK